jgi:quercetin dioxygenase-like cupin family protein
MATIHYHETEAVSLRTGVERRIGHTQRLMMAIIDFNDGPQAQPDPPHSHPHEQATYVAEGEILFILDGLPTRMQTGDMFLVPADMPHSIQLLSEHVRLVDCFTPIREDFLESTHQLEHLE